MHTITKTNEFPEKFRRGRGWWVKSVLLSNVSCSDFSFKIIEKHTLKIPFCIIFMPKKPCSKVQILQYKFLDWIFGNDPPPLRNFSENSSVLEWGCFPYLSLYSRGRGCSYIASKPQCTKSLGPNQPQNLKLRHCI